MRLRFLALCAVGALALAGCSSLPSSGPTADAILKGSEAADETSPYAVVPLSETALAILRTRREPSLSAQISPSAKSSARLVGVGDSLALTIWEGGDGGLFSASTAGSLATGSRSTALQNVVVDPSGEITVPYLGRVKVAGNSPYMIEKLLEQRLSDKSIQPQVVVSVVGNVSNTVNVLGDVGSGGGRVALTQRNDRVLDILAQSGGARAPAYDEVIQITRGSRSARAPLSHIMRNPHENIPVAPGDTILVQRDPLAFVLLGATQRVAQVPFEAEQVTLAEALGKAGGPIDQRADAAAVFIFRPKEDPAVVERFTGKRPSGGGPIVYRLDLKTGPGLLYAQSFQVRNKDLLYVANSDSYEVSKFFAFIRGGTGIAYDVGRVGSPFY